MWDESRPPDFDFPLSDYYRSQIVDARTISRGGPWWAAILLIRDPKTDQPFLGFYRWQHTASGWKQRKAFSCRSRKDAMKIIHIVEEFLDQLV